MHCRGNYLALNFNNETILLCLVIEVRLKTKYGLIYNNTVLIKLILLQMSAFVNETMNFPQIVYELK